MSELPFTLESIIERIDSTTNDNIRSLRGQGGWEINFETESDHILSIWIEERLQRAKGEHKLVWCWSVAQSSCGSTKNILQVAAAYQRASKFLEWLAPRLPSSLQI